MTGCTSRSASAAPDVTRVPAPRQGTISGLLIISGMHESTTTGSVAATGPVTVTADVGPGGRFAMTVPGGEYEVTGRSPQFGDGRYTCHADRQPVDVRPGRSSTVKVLCVEK